MFHFRLFQLEPYRLIQKKIHESAKVHKNMDPECHRER